MANLASRRSSGGISSPVIGLIPARGGSKRIHRKNIRSFAGRPIIAWTIDALRNSGVVDRIFVSTDDEEIASVARREGAEIPFLRPPELSGDLVATLPVVTHAIHNLAAQGVRPDLICCAYATAPLMAPADVRRGLELLVDSAGDYAFSCGQYSFPIYRALRILEGGGVEPISPEFIQARSQDLPPAFHDAGQFYWGRSEAFVAGRPFFSPASRAVVVPSYRVQDIDTEEDWLRAELLMASLQARNEPGR